MILFPLKVPHVLLLIKLKFLCITISSKLDFVGKKSSLGTLGTSTPGAGRSIVVVVVVVIKLSGQQTALIELNGFQIGIFKWRNFIKIKNEFSLHWRNYAFENIPSRLLTVFRPFYDTSLLTIHSVKNERMLTDQHRLAASKSFLSLN